MQAIRDERPAFAEKFTRPGVFTTYSASVYFNPVEVVKELEKELLDGGDLAPAMGFPTPLVDELPVI